MKHPLTRKIMIRLGIMVALSCGVGIAQHVDTYSADGDIGIYVVGFGIEHTPDTMINIWRCSDGGWLPDYRCPADEKPTIGTRVADTGGTR